MLCLDRGLFSALGPELQNDTGHEAMLWREKFDPTTDLVVSPFRPEAGFVGVNNQVRDRLVGSAYPDASPSSKSPKEATWSAYSSWR